MDKHTTTRRQLVKVAAYGGGAAIVAGGAALAGEARSATVGVSPELTRLVNEADRLNTLADRYDVEVHTPALRRLHEQVGAVPHIEVEGPPEWHRGAVAKWTTADEQHVRHAKYEVKQRVTFWWPGANDARARHQAKRRLVAAALWRERKVDRLRKASGIDAIAERAEVIGRALVDVEEAVLSFQPANIADLNAKLAFLAKVDLFSVDGTVGRVIADVAILAGEA